MKILAAIGALLVAAVLVGVVYQRSGAAADRARFPPPGRMIDVDGLALHLDCRGSGEPVVVLEAGLTSGSASWMLVHDALAEVTRVCAYDRPGIDWSEPIGRTADAAEIAQRLRKLLAAAGESGPFVLVGMSAGGVYVREYQRTWPADVVGMVLVDSSHEQQADRLPDFQETDLDRGIALCAWLQPIGVVRATRAIDPLLDRFDIPEGPREVIRANLYRSQACAAILAELRSFRREVHDTEPPSSLGDMPLIVLSQGNEPSAIPEAGISLEMAREGRAVWNELQEELAALSSRGRRIIATESGHLIQFEQPQLVIDAVSEVVTAVR